MSGLDGQRLLHKIWSSRNPVALALWPISIIYCGAVELRRLAYRIDLLHSVRFEQPVIVVGNLTVGGSGKTPLTIWLANYLKEQGFSPGIVSRGYGRKTCATIRVHPDSDPSEAGDEPLLIARSTMMPVAVAHKRSDAVTMLLAQTECDIFISDDGLQHLSLNHDLSVAVVDDERGMGNSFCLPAGPLRESRSLLKRADLRISRGKRRSGSYAFEVAVTAACNVLNPQHARDLASFSNEQVVAVAGIRNPDRFFQTLSQYDISCKPRAFPDHHVYSNLDFADLDDPDISVLMTEKDAVKCEGFARPNWWAVGIRVQPEAGFVNDLSQRLACFEGKRGAAD